MKKTLQEEIRGNRNLSTDDLNKTGPEMVLSSSNGIVTMDEISFKYLKHVIMKFVTCRDVEAKHLLRPVATILRFSNDEERLLYDMYKWKMSWFFGGSKPDIGQWSSWSGVVVISLGTAKNNCVFRLTAFSYQNWKEWFICIIIIPWPRFVFLSNVVELYCDYRFIIFTHCVEL